VSAHFLKRFTPTNDVCARPLGLWGGSYALEEVRSMTIRGWFAKFAQSPAKHRQGQRQGPARPPAPTPRPWCGSRPSPATRCGLIGQPSGMASTSSRCSCQRAAESPQFGARNFPHLAGQAISLMRDRRLHSWVAGRGALLAAEGELMTAFERTCSGTRSACSRRR
jgi:hypothetical protein